MDRATDVIGGLGRVANPSWVKEFGGVKVFEVRSCDESLGKGACVARAPDSDVRRAGVLPEDEAPGQSSIVSIAHGFRRRVAVSSTS